MKPELPPKTIIEQQVKLALEEDIGSGDVSATLLKASTKASATVITRENGILCGRAWFDRCFKQLANEVDITWYAKDGDSITKESTLCKLSGPAHVLLTAERSALNFLQLLSGVATRTQQYVQKIAHTKAKLLDTRKTIPGLRLAQKYAVRCGGGYNHRIGLFDAIMLKENHLSQFDSIKDALLAARKNHPTIPIIVEVETLAELDATLPQKPTRILLDNFTIDMLKHAVEKTKGLVPLEASGNVNLETISNIAETKVDFISVGDITKHITPLDLSMRVL